MMRKLLIGSIVALALAGCNGGTEGGNRAEANPTAGDNIVANADIGEGNADAGEGNVQAAVLALSDKQRNGVLNRALIDANLPCDGVISSTRIDDVDRQPAWKANCKNGDSHIVSITRDGTANIVSRAGRR